MAKLSRTKELWHIPKRGNVHQTIYMVHLLTGEKFSGKSWSRTKQELLATEMGKAGLTEKGIALSHQSVRTLLANIPKYLGFIYIDESTTPSRLIVTEVGNLLVNHHKIKNVKQEKNLKRYRAKKSLIETSNIFNEQMLKLIITNPIILKDCQQILVFPFRFTLHLLLELEYLDKEEIGYILFHVKNEDELYLTIQKIKNFRALPPDSRTKEINSYAKTYDSDCLITRCTNNYGPRQFAEKLIPKTIMLAYYEKEIPIYGTGKNIRDWLYVEDHCLAIEKILYHGKKGESYNISGNNEIDNITIVKEILALMNKSEDLITFVEDRPGHDFRYSMESKKIRNELKWSHEFDFKEGIKKTVKWYLDNKEWWKDISKEVFSSTPWKN